MILLDTHVLVWLVAASRRLGSRSRALIERSLRTRGVAVSSITFWEIALLLERGRLPGLRDAAAWRRDVLAAGVVEQALDGSIALRASGLAGMSEDPADRFIVATALVHEGLLVTADERILGWRGPLDRHDARA